MTHVYPLNDLKGHDTNSTMCHCEPTIDWKNSLVIHNAFDFREVKEELSQVPVKSKKE